MRTPRAARLADALDAATTTSPAGLAVATGRLVDRAAPRGSTDAGGRVRSCFAPAVVAARGRVRTRLSSGSPR